MIWRDQVFNFGSETATRVTKSREKTGEAVAETVFSFEILSPSLPILRAKIENVISSDCVLCYIPQANGIFGNLGNFENV